MLAPSDLAMLTVHVQHSAHTFVARPWSGGVKHVRDSMFATAYHCLHVMTCRRGEFSDGGDGHG
eukprot:9862255-Alexandrium_andersonii.AAC.1